MSVYRTVAQLTQAMTQLANAAPEICQVFTLAEPSVEGVEIKGLHISVGESPGPRNGVLLLGGVHARELMNPEAIVDLAGDLLISYILGRHLNFVVPGSGAPGAYWTASAIQVMLESLDIYLVPCSNPDGRNYVMSTDGLWRKNRRPLKAATCSDGTEPVGVDLNRNCAILWGVIPPGGEISCNPCDYQVYCGPVAFSEPEARNIEGLLAGFRIDTFADVHSYTEEVLWPWGHAPNQTTDPAENFTPLATGTCGPIPDSSYTEYIDPLDLRKLESVGAHIVSDTAKVRGHVYDARPSFKLYPTTGTNPEYAYSRHISDHNQHKTSGWTIETGPYINNSVPDSFHPTDPSQTILDAKAAMLSLLMQSVCAIDLIGTELFGLDAEAPADPLAGLRNQRDALWESEAGRGWLELYRQLHPALLGRIATDEVFRSHVTHLVATATAMVSDPESVLSEESVRHGLAVIDDLAAISPQHLRPQLQTASRLVQTVSGLNAAAALAMIAGRSPS